MPLKTSQDEPPSVNLTPMIDIVFLLIIFFMVGTQFTEMEEHNLDLEVPEVGDVSALTPAPKRRVINVGRDGRVLLDAREVSIDELQSTLTDAQREYAQLGVLVRGDGGGAFQHVAEVLNACRQAGISELGISVRLAQKP